MCSFLRKKYGIEYGHKIRNKTTIPKQIIEDVDKYRAELIINIEEEIKELEALKQNPDAISYTVAELVLEISDLEEQLAELEIFSEEGKEVLEQGGDFFDRKLE